MGSSEAKREYNRFTLTMAVDIAAPHTWPAAIMPVLVATCCAYGAGFPVSAPMSLVCLVICILMQSAVNTFNDYYDYVKGEDSKDDNVDPSDAVLVYNNVNPRTALGLAIGFLVAAFALGAFVIARCGIIPLVIALVGALFVVTYSAGKTPVSYLPIGELVSGVVMGGLIPLATFQAVSGTFSWLALVWAVPEIILIGLIMLTNNTCDVERDIPAGRRTLAVVLGRKRARALYHALVIVAIAAIVVIVAAFFPNGTIVMPFMLLASYPIVAALMRNPLDQSKRLQAMPQILSVNVVLGSFYCAGILASGMPLTL